MKIEDVEFPSVIFVTGTGTDVGKSYATGWLAKMINQSGQTCITQKLIQTGNINRSEDIELHRKIMGIPMTPEDENKLTYPCVFTYPCSPDLAARLDNKIIDINKISDATAKLSGRYDVVLVEGAGGIMVPIEGKYLMADYIKEHNLPVVVVISGQLGSINHALMTLNVIETYGLKLLGVVYNPYFDKDEIIVDDTKYYLKNWINDKFGNIPWIEMPVIN